MKIVLVAFSFLIPAAALAQPQLSPDGAGTETGNAAQARTETNRNDAEQAGERQICRRIRPSNSHRSRRLCLTAAQWREMSDER